jgi:hypothetical protein
MITVGANEKTGGATDRDDPAGRLKLLRTNAGVYKDVVPRLVAAAARCAAARHHGSSRSTCRSRATHRWT